MNDKQKQTKTFHYKVKGLRLSDGTIKTLATLKKEFGKSYNLLMRELISCYQKHKKQKTNSLYEKSDTTKVPSL